MLLRKLAQDIALTGLPFAVGVFDSEQGQWVAVERGSGSEALAVPQGFENMVLVLPGRQHAVSFDADGAPDAVWIVSAVCDWAMDERGHGWPELADVDGSFIALLAPEHHRREVTWVGGGVTIPLGELESAWILPLWR